MRNLPSIVANYDSASTGFSDGKLRDNPGSGVLYSGMNKKIYNEIEAEIEAKREEIRGLENER